MKYGRKIKILGIFLLACLGGWALWVFHIIWTTVNATIFVRGITVDEAFMHFIAIICLTIIAAMVCAFGSSQEYEDNRRLAIEALPKAPTLPSVAEIKYRDDPRYYRERHHRRHAYPVG